VCWSDIDKKNIRCSVHFAVWWSLFRFWLCGVSWSVN
jgi:hypothetical protein